MKRAAHLKLIEDPSVGVVWFLNQLPLETSATYLALLLAYAIEHDMLTEQERTRIKTLVECILSDRIYRAA